MDIIQAWKKAKDGQRLIRTLPSTYIHIKGKPGPWELYKGMIPLPEQLSRLHEMDLLADDWDVQKEKRWIEYTYEQLFHITKIPSVPNNAKVRIEWEE